MRCGVGATLQVNMNTEKELRVQRTAVVGEVDEHFVVGATLEDFATAQTVDGVSLSLKHVQEQLCSDNAASVIDLATLVHVLAGNAISCGLVEHLARERVLAVVGNVVFHHQNNVGLGHTAGLDNLSDKIATKNIHQTKKQHDRCVNDSSIAAYSARTRTTARKQHHGHKNKATARTW